MPFTDLLMNELLGLVPATSHHLGLMTTNPLLVQDPLTVEVVGPTYSRQAGMTLSAGNYTNNRELRWYGLPRGTVIEALGVFDAPVNGNLIYAFRVGPHSFPKGGSYRIGAGGLTADPTSFTYVDPAKAKVQCQSSTSNYFNITFLKEVPAKGNDELRIQIYRGSDGALVVNEYIQNIFPIAAGTVRTQYNGGYLCGNISRVHIWHRNWNGSPVYDNSIYDGPPSPPA